MEEVLGAEEDEAAPEEEAAPAPATPPAKRGRPAVPTTPPTTKAGFPPSNFRSTLKPPGRGISPDRSFVVKVLQVSCVAMALSRSRAKASAA